MSYEQAVSYAAKRRRRHRLRVAAIAVVSAVAVLIGAASAYYLWFTSSLDNALRANADDKAGDALVDSSDGPFYMLLLASDTYGAERSSEDYEQHTDVMMLARIDVEGRQVTLLSIPRDTPYYFDDGTVSKINGLYNIGGAGLTIEAVSQLTGCPISHYALFSVADCKSVVDLLDGVEIDVDTEINNLDPETGENVNIQPGLQTLDGMQAQAYTISRHDVDTDQDQHRQSKVRTLIEAVMAKILDRPITDIPGTVIDLARFVETDMRSDDLVSLALGFANGSGGITMYSGTGPYDGDVSDEYGIWLCYDNPEGWAEVMSVVDSGGDPSTVTYE